MLIRTNKQCSILFQGSKKTLISIGKMLDDSILELKFILSTAKLTAQQEKEIRAELSQLESDRNAEALKGTAVKNGISLYGSYFSSTVLY